MMFSGFVKQSGNEMKFNALLEKKKESLPIKLQAYERLLLFCERLNPSKLLLRVNPIGTDSQSYLHLLLANIEQEYEHNLVQQIYVTEESWNAVKGAKLSIMNKFVETAENSESAKELRDNLLKNYSQEESPTESAIFILKKSVKKLL